MARKSKITVELWRQQVVEHYVGCRVKFKRALINPHLSQDEHDEAVTALHALSRDTSLTRLRRCDAVGDCLRGHLRVTRISRMHLREMALHGELPGIIKPPW